MKIKYYYFLLTIHIRVVLIRLKQGIRSSLNDEVMIYYKFLRFLCYFFLSAFLTGCFLLFLLLFFNPDNDLIFITCTFNILMIIDFFILKMLLIDIKRNIEQKKRFNKANDFYRKFTELKKNSRFN